MGAEGNLLSLTDIRTALKEDMTSVVPGLVEKSLSEWKPTWKPEAQPASDLRHNANDEEVEEIEVHQVDAEQNVGSMIENFDFKVPVVKGVLPVGSAIVGLGLGGIAFNVTDKMVKPVTGDSTNFLNIAAHIAMAGILASPITTRPLGKTAGQFAAGTIVMALVVRHTPVGGWFAKLEEWVSGVVPNVAQGQFSQQSFSHPEMYPYANHSNAGLASAIYG